jgi:ferric-dicitrate binding protein FerR (iron transport regulator)
MNQDRNSPRDEVQELLAQAGPPPAIPARELAQIRKAARHEWRARHQGSAFRRLDYRPLMAIAATLLVTLGVVWWWTGRQPSGGGLRVATVELVRGDALAASASGASWNPSRGDEVLEGSSVSTQTGRLAVQLGSGQSIRFDTGTEASIVSPTRVELAYGTVYIDSRPSSGSAVEVATPLGLVTEIGTQFEVRVGNGNGPTVRVRVREGSVSLAHDGESYSASIGQQLTIDASGEVYRATVPTRGSEWEWILQAAPGIELEGRSLLYYLQWVARETGWELQYTDASLEATTAAIELHGSTEGLTPEESLRVFLLASGIGYELRDGVLLVGGPVEGVV